MKNKQKVSSMPIKNKPGVRRFPVLLVIAGLVGLGGLVATSGFAFAAAKESHDSFCGSCHTQPESTYLQRSTGSQPVDLASFHTGQETHCIDCHSGKGVPGRVTAELMGARNATRWFTGTAVQPAPLLVPIGDENCLKCHSAVTSRAYVTRSAITVPGRLARALGQEGRTGHWHVFLARWQSIDKNAAGCVDCHSSHSTGAAAQNGFLAEANVTRVCNDCHRNIQD